MKKYFKQLSIVLALTFTLSAVTFGQSFYASNTSKASTFTVENTPEKNSSSFALSKTTESNFNSLFPSATEQNWSINEDNSLVSFLNNGKKATASFTAKGKLSYVITKVGITELPEDFRSAITKTYSNYQLFHASEIKAFGEIAYQAIIENEAGYITLKYTAEGIEEIQTVKK